MTPLFWGGDLDPLWNGIKWEWNKLFIRDHSKIWSTHIVKCMNAQFSTIFHTNLSPPNISFPYQETSDLILFSDTLRSKDDMLYLFHELSVETKNLPIIQPLKNFQGAMSVKAKPQPFNAITLGKTTIPQAENGDGEFTWPELKGWLLVTNPTFGGWKGHFDWITWITFLCRQKSLALPSALLSLSILGRFPCTLATHTDFSPTCQRNNNMWFTTRICIP